jgi:4-hydroxy-tetrahydrodipicolinate synthase
MEYKNREAKEYAREKMKGLWIAIPTPFDENGEIDEKGLRKNLRHYRDKLKVAGIFCNGNVGEFWALTVQERKRTVEIIVEEVGKDVCIIAHTAHHCLKDAVELTRHAQDVGAHFAISVNPYIAGKNDAAVYRYYQEICCQVDIGIGLFNAPYVGYSMTPELIARLADIDNVCVVKDTDTLDHVTEVRRRVKDKIIVSDPTEERWLMNILHFKQPVLLADPDPYMLQTPDKLHIKEYTELALAGDEEKATELYAKLYPVRRVSEKWFLHPLIRGEMPMASLKYWTELLGMVGGRVRPPLNEISETQKAELEKDLRQVGLIGGKK